MKTRLIARPPRFVEDGAAEVLVHQGHDLLELVPLSELATLRLAMTLMELYTESVARRK